MILYFSEKLLICAHTFAASHDRKGVVFRKRTISAGQGTSRDSVTGSAASLDLSHDRKYLPS